jgi:hypothetical protein
MFLRTSSLLRNSLVDWVNPHVFVHIDVRDKGKTEAWALEARPPVELVRLGWSKEALKPGVVIKVSGTLSRSDVDLLGTVTDAEVKAGVNASHKAHVFTIELADGSKLWDAPK